MKNMCDDCAKIVAGVFCRPYKKLCQATGLNRRTHPTQFPGTDRELRVEIKTSTNLSNPFLLHTLTENLATNQVGEILILHIFSKNFSAVVFQPDFAGFFVVGQLDTENLKNRQKSLFHEILERINHLSG